LKFHDHSKLQGQHAFLSASSYHWLNYDEEKLTERFLRAQAVQRGTELHDLACRLITLRIKMPRNHQTLNQYVNDALGFDMTPEQILYYSPNCFGTADTICFRDGFLRIHDLKTGEGRVSMKQLMIYAALFCLEYLYEPKDLKGIELRIYQNDDVMIENPDPAEIRVVMDTIVAFDKQLNELKAGDF